MARQRYKLRNKAFSLLEVIIAVGILTAGIVAVVEAFSFSARVTGLSCDIINAVLLATDKTQELEFKARRGLLQEEQVSDLLGKFKWKYALNLDPDLKLYKLDLAISWMRMNREEVLNLNTYLKNEKM